MGWTAENIPSQRGRIAVITGATSGLGLEMARMLLARGARVIMPVRNPKKGESVAESLRQEIEGAEVTAAKMELGDLASIRAFAEGLRRDHAQIDLLINNAGVGAIKPARTVDGFGLEIGVNYLGHFALTGRVLDLISRSGQGRVVSLTSQAQSGAKLDVATFDQPEEGMYGPSKLANSLFAYELQRRIEASGVLASSLVAHPGASKTPGAVEAVGEMGSRNAVTRALARFFVDRVMQTPQMGAMPAVRAATDPEAKGGELYGPSGFMGMRGEPEVAKPPKAATDTQLARALWERSVTLTGVEYDVLKAGQA